MSNYAKQNFEYDAVVKKQKLINMDNALGEVDTALGELGTAISSTDTALGELDTAINSANNAIQANTTSIEGIRTDITKLRNDIIVRVGSGTTTVNIAPGATGVLYVGYNEEGYSRVGVLGYNFKNNNIIVVRYDEISFTLWNRGATAITEVNYEVKFLLKKK